MAKMFTLMFGADVESKSVKNSIERVQNAFKQSNLKIVPKIDESAILQMNKSLDVTVDKMTKLKRYSASFSQGGVGYNISQLENGKSDITADYSTKIRSLQNKVSNFYKEAIESQQLMTKATRNGADDLKEKYSNALDSVLKKIRETETEIQRLGGSTDIEKITSKQSTLSGLSEKQATLEEISAIKMANKELVRYNSVLRETEKYERELITIRSDVSRGVKSNTDNVKEYVDSLERKVSGGKKELDQIEKSLSGTDNLSVAQKKRADSTDRITIAEKKAAVATEQHSGGIKSLSSNIKQAIGYYTGYGLAIQGVQLAMRGFSEAISTIKDLNKAMIDVQMVTESTASETQKLAQEYSNLAKEMGATTVQVAEGATEWLRQGKTIEETSELLKQSLIMSKVGAIDSAQATTLLTSTLNGYKMEASDAAHVVDALSAVDLAAATSVEELATALQSTANSARVQGVEFDQLVGQIGAVSEATRRSASIVGNSFKTIYARLTSVAAGKALDEEGEAINDVEKVLTNLGIKLRDGQKQWRDMGDVLDEIATKWKNMEDTEKSQVSTAVAGVRQRETFIALMENYARAQELATVATESNGSAQRKFEIYLEGIEARLNSLKASFENLVYSEATQNIFKFLISSAQTLIEVLNFLVNNTFTRLVIGITAITVAATKLKGVFESIKKSKIISSIFDAAKIDGVANLPSLLKFITSGAYSAAGGFTALLASMWPLLAAGAAIAVIVGIVGLLTESTEKLTKKIEDLNKEYSENQSIISQLEDKSKTEGLTKAEQNYLTVLKNQNDALEKQIDLENQRLAVKKTEDIVGQSGYTSSSSNVGITVQEAQAMRYKSLVSSMETETDVNKLKSLQEEINGITKDFDEWMVAITAEEVATGELSDAALYLKGILEGVGYWQENLEEKTDATTESFEQELPTLESFNNSLDNIQSAYSTLSDAIDGYNKSGQLTVDQIQSILSLDSEYLSMLSMENGQLILNEQALQDKVIAQINEAKSTIYSTAVMKLNALASQEVSTSTGAAAGAAETAVDSIDSETNAYTRQNVELAKNKVLKGGASTTEVNKILDEMNSQIAMIDAMVQSVGSDFKTSMGVASSSSGSAKSSVDSLNESIKETISLLEDQKSNYETAFSYMADRIQDEIDLITEKKEKEEKYWDEKIDALKEQNDLIDSQIELQQLQENLAKAKATKVYRLQDGRFGYYTDESAVSEAQSALDEYNRKKLYEDEIKKLEALKKASSDSYDSQIKNLEEYKKSWSDIVSSVKKEQDRLIAEMVLGTSLDGEQWKTRIANAENYATQYKSIVDRIAAENARLTSSTAGGSSGGGASGVGGQINTKKFRVVNSRSGKTLKDGFVSEDEANAYLKRLSGSLMATSYVEKYAKGIDYVPNNQIAMVGDAPNSEIVVGSKLNGNPTALSKGSGVIPATMSKNLTEIGRFTMPQLVNTIASRIGANQYSYSFDKLVLPNVSNASEFIRSLKNLPNLAIQAGGSRA